MQPITKEDAHKCAEEVRETMRYFGDFDSRYNAALDYIDKHHCPLSHADAELYGDIMFNARCYFGISTIDYDSEIEEALKDEFFFNN